MITKCGFIVVPLADLPVQNQTLHAPNNASLAVSVREASYWTGMREDVFRKMTAQVSKLFDYIRLKCRHIMHK